MRYEPLVSIIMPTYNNEKFIRESIESVIFQSYENWELIIVDDCSTDETENILKEYSYQHENITYIKLGINSGTAVARNLGIERAKGKYIAFLDSDDLWCKNKLALQIAFMETNDYLFSYTKYTQIHENGSPKGKVISSLPKVDYQRMLHKNYIGNSTAAYNCEALGKIYAPQIRKRNDYSLWLQILKIGICAYRLDEVLMKYRVRSDSLSRKKAGLIKYQWELYREVEKLSVSKSTFYFCSSIVRKLLVKS